MGKDEIKRILNEHLSEIREFGVSGLSLFGSAARDEIDEKSDVDLLVEFEKPIGLFQFFRLQHFIEDLLGVAKVDLLMPGAIKPRLRENILAEAIRVA